MIDTSVQQLKQDLFDTTGRRLIHILEHIGFQEGRGRARALQEYLGRQRPEVFGTLKYTTARSWFQDSAPPMAKIDAIIDVLQDKYSFHHNIPLIKTWWKLGGLYPYVGDEDGNDVQTVISIQKDAIENKEKNQYLIMGLVTEVTGNAFSTLSSEDLVKIKDSAAKLADDFSNPFKSDCPTEYLKAVIQSELQIILAEKESH